MNLIERVPNWLRGALGTTKPLVPHHLGTAEILPVVDAFQRGHFNANWGRIQVTVPQNTGEGARVLIQNGSETSWLIMALEARTTMAGVCSMTLQYGDLAAVWGIRLGNVQVPAGDATDLTGFLGSHRPLWLPWNCRLSIFTSATGAGETQSFEVFAAEFPKGWAPGGLG